MIDKISVVMPYYDNDKSIIESIRSVLNQTTEIKIIIIIVDDGSKSSPQDLINNNFNSFLEKNENRSIKVISQKNSGASSSRNRGVEEADTEYVAFLDSDDLWEKNKLEVQLDLIEKNNLNVIGSDWNNKSYYLTNKKKQLYKLSKVQIAIKWWPHISTIIIKKTLFNKVGRIDTNFIIGEDGDFFMNIANHTDLFIARKSLVRCHTFKNFEFANGLSSNLLAMNKQEIAVIRKHINNIFIKSILIIWVKLKYIKRVSKRMLFLYRNK